MSIGIYNSYVGLHNRLIGLVDFFLKLYSPRRDSNSQSSDSKSDALSIRPRGHRQFFKLKLFHIRSVGDF